MTSGDISNAKPRKFVGDPAPAEEAPGTVHPKDIVDKGEPVEEAPGTIHAESLVPDEETTSKRKKG